MLLRPGSPDVLPQRSGIERCSGDLFDAATLRCLLRGCDTAVNRASALNFVVMTLLELVLPLVIVAMLARVAASSGGGSSSTLIANGS